MNDTDSQIVVNDVSLISSDDIDDDIDDATAAAIAEVSKTKVGVKIKFQLKRNAPLTAANDLFETSMSQRRMG